MSDELGSCPGLVGPSSGVPLPDAITNLRDPGSEQEREEDDHDDERGTPHGGWSAG